jgi:hypothetical protein
MQRPSHSVWPGAPATTLLPLMTTDQPKLSGVGLRDRRVFDGMSETSALPYDNSTRLALPWAQLVRRC